MLRILFVITEDWAFVSHRLHLAEYAIERGFKVAVLTRIGRYRELFESLGIKVFDWGLDRRSLSVLGGIKAISQLYRVIQDFRPDVVHPVALKPVIYTGIASRLFFGGMVVSALGGVGYIFSSTQLFARILRRPTCMILKFALCGKRRNLILQNADDVDLFVRAGIVGRHKINLIKGAGVEIDKFRMYPLPRDVKRVMLPARMLWDKGVFEFVSVARRLTKVRPDVKFVLVGDVDEHNPNSIPKAAINDWVAEGCVEHWEGVQHDQMAEVYKMATIVCLPSYREGLPKALLEAASVGRPLVAFDVPGCREVVMHGINGELVPFGRVDLLANSILSFIDDEEKTKQFGTSSREIVRAEFASGVVNDQTCAVWLRGYRK